MSCWTGLRPVRSGCGRYWERAPISVSVHGDVARIETDESGMELLLRRRSETVRKLQDLGFSYITLDLEGFRSGSMDKGIGEEKEQ